MKDSSKYEHVNILLKNIMQTQYDISNELIIQRYSQGVKLLPPNNVNPFKHGVSVDDMLHMPFHVYFLDVDSIIKRVNEPTIKTFNFLSTTDMVGRTVRDLTSKRTAEIVLAHNRVVLKANQMAINEEKAIIVEKNIPIKFLSMKFPWYDKNNQLKGIFGCSINITNMCGALLADSLSLLIQSGLMQTSFIKNNKIPLLSNAKDIFTQRENDVLYHLIRGKTSREIAARLSISARTVEQHIVNMKVKTQSNSKSELIEKVVDQSLM